MDLATSKLKNAALGLLARREHAEEELKLKLIHKYQPTNVQLASVFHYLHHYSYLDDARFAALYCQSRINKGFGPERISHELSEKGVSADTVLTTINKVNDWVEHANHVRCKKFKTLPHDYKQKQKQIQFLRYRGFRFDDIASALSLEQYD